MNEKELARKLEKVSEEIDRAKQRIMRIMANPNDKYETVEEENEWQPSSYERGFFTLD
ncbi:MAG: hypothetical protein ACOX2E_08275 [Syntrophaceticus sp.]|jgi:hypothetical protein